MHLNDMRQRGHGPVTGGEHSSQAAPPFGGAAASSPSIPAGAGPDELETFLAFHLDQGGVDRSGEARIVQLDREVVALGVPGGLLPGRSQLDTAGEDAEVRSFVGGVLDPNQLGLGIEREGANRAGEAVLGQSSTVLLKRSIGVCFVICWRTLQMSFSSLLKNGLVRACD